MIYVILKYSSKKISGNFLLNSFVNILKAGLIVH